MSILSNLAIVIALVYIGIRIHNRIYGNDLLTALRAYLMIFTMSALLLIHAVIENDQLWIVAWAVVCLWTGYQIYQQYQPTIGDSS